MARNKNRGSAEARDGMAESEGDEAFAPEAGELDQQREDSDGGIGEETEAEAFPITLKFPDVPIAVWEHFAASLNAFQEELVHSKDEDLKPLRITYAEAPSPTVPDVHKGPHAGFKAVKSDEFKLRLSNGRYITSTKE